MVLCTVQVSSDGVLSIHPDFNRGRKAYVKESQKQFGKGGHLLHLSNQFVILLFAEL